MTAPELKPCPFCGGTDTFILNGPVEDDWSAVACDKCSARGPTNYTDPHAIAAWNRRADLAAVQPDPNAGAVKVKPLDLSNLLKHAFMCGWDASETISSSCEYNWTEYDPTDNAAYARIMAALEPHPDPRDEVIARLVDALTVAANRLDRCAVDYETGSYEFIETCEWVDEARAALAAAKAVQP